MNHPPITLVNIPMPPSSNGIYREAKLPGGRRKRVKTTEMVAWEKIFDGWALENRSILQYAHSLFQKNQEYTLTIDCNFYFLHSRILTQGGKPKRLDTSNFLKPLHDKISQAIGVDDCYFWHGSFSKRVQTNGKAREFVDVVLTLSPIIKDITHGG